MMRHLNGQNALHKSLLKFGVLTKIDQNVHEEI